MKILSFTSLHDSSVCVLDDGEVIGFYKEERYTGEKRAHDPWASIKMACDNHDIHEFDYVVVCSEYWSSRNPFAQFFEKNYPTVKILDRAHSHHKHHALNAFYNSGFDEGYVVVVDGVGSGYNVDGKVFATEAESVFKCKFGEQPVPIYKAYAATQGHHGNLQSEIEEHYPDTKISIKSSNSICQCYDAVASYMGMWMDTVDGPYAENGKAMGLSAYGEAMENNSLYLNHVGVDNYFEPKIDIQGKYKGVANINLSTYDPGCDPTAVITKDNYKPYADFAATVQRDSELAVANIIEPLLKQNESNNIIISGGYGLNCVANMQYTRLFKAYDIDWYIEPLADDSGNCIGAAKGVHFENGGTGEPKRLTTTAFHGVEPDYEGLDYLVEYFGYTATKATEDDIALELYKNNCIALFKGKSEAGPRALGNRSILYNPSKANAQDEVNKIKKREWYRPFAATVLKSEASNWFDLGGQIKETPFMTHTVPILSDELAEKVPGVIHNNRMCRIQTLDKQHDVVYNGIVEAFSKYSGIPMVLNTSFNLAGHPLVETIEDAFLSLRDSDLYGVYFADEGLLVHK